jgi:hypothetical protein
MRVTGTTSLALVLLASVLSGCDRPAPRLRAGFEAAAAGDFVVERSSGVLRFERLFVWCDGAGRSDRMRLTG